MKKYLIATIIFLAMAGTITSLSVSLKKLEETNSRIQENLEYYSSFGNENIVLQNTVKELEQSKDSLIQQINAIQKELNLKPKETETIVYTQTILRDTIVEVIPQTFDFEAVLRPNELTTITVLRQDTTLTVTPEIRNSQTLFVQAEKKYKYKNFFSRLIHFNFSKTTTRRYYIDNSNDLIQVEDTRVINVVQ